MGLGNSAFKRTQRIVARFIAAKATELSDKYRAALRAISDETKPDPGPAKELAQHLLDIIRPGADQPAWFVALSKQKMNAVRSLNRDLQVFLGDVSAFDHHPTLRMVLRDKVEQWGKPLRTLELAMQIGEKDREIPHGHFTVVPIPGITKKQLDDSLAALDEAASKISSKFPQVLYGNVYLTKHLAKKAVAWYDPNTDGLSINVTAKKRFSDIFTLIHELGHRHEYKFLSEKSKREYWRLSTQKEYESIEFDEKLRDQVADEAVELAKAKATGKPLPRMSDLLVAWLKSPHPTGNVRNHTTAYLQSKITEDELRKLVKGKANAKVLTDKVLRGPLAVTPYGATKPGENYADGFAHFVLGMDMPPELAAILAAESH